MLEYYASLLREQAQELDDKRENLEFILGRDLLMDNVIHYFGIDAMRSCFDSIYTDYDIETLISEEW